MKNQDALKEIEARVAKAFTEFGWKQGVGTYVEPETLHCCYIGALLLGSGCSVDLIRKDGTDESIRILESLGLDLLSTYNIHKNIVYMNDTEGMDWEDINSFLETYEADIYDVLDYFDELHNYDEDPELLGVEEDDDDVYNSYNV